MIRAVFMDIDNTLLDFDAAAQEGMEHCFEDAGLTYKPEMFTVFKEENDQIWKKIEQGILTMDDLPLCALAASLKKLGLEADWCGHGDAVSEVPVLQCSTGGGSEGNP